MIGHRCYLIKCPSWTEQMYYFQKDTKYQTNSVFTKFHLTNFKGWCADRCSSFDISLFHKCLYHARLNHKARSDSRENYYCFNDTDFMFGPIYIKFNIMLMILRLIKTCKGPIKIFRGPLILGYMHVFEWDIRRCPI